MKEKLLPIGSIITLKNISPKICIIGYLNPIDEETFTTYIGAIHPFGLIEGKTKSFTKDEIDNIYFVGYQTEETLKFEEVLYIISEKVKPEGE